MRIVLMIDLVYAVKKKLNSLRIYQYENPI